MDVTSLLSVLRTAEKLKDTTRHCYTSGGRQESVAEHSWRLCLFAYFLRDQFPELDMDKVLHMCLLHDMGEAFTGDIPTFWKDGAHESEESRLLKNWVDTLPQPYRQELTELYAEMDALETGEAKLYKALDKLEAVDQHNLSDLSTWIPLEYELNLTYGNDQVAHAPFLKQLREALLEQTVQKVKEKK